MRVAALRVDGVEHGLVTDERPTIAFVLESDLAGEELRTAQITAGSWTLETTRQSGIVYGGPMEPHREYEVHVRATGVSGAVAEASVTFRTGRMGTPWKAAWITDAAYRTPKKQSPVPMAFRGAFALPDGARRVWVEATALGVYELEINGAKVGTDYFAPGFTSYRHQIQYQTHDVTNLLGASNTIVATVAGGWAVGSFTYLRKNTISADRQAFLCEIRVEMADGSVQTFGTDRSWEVSTQTPFRMAEWYDGETYDATFDPATARWKRADLTAPRGEPRLLAQYGPSVRAQQVLHPIAQTVSPSGEVVYDFGQNFAGVIHARLRGDRGQTVTFRHAEIVVDDELYVTSLRTAKATATYTCVDGEQEYSPRLTYMGFRYVGVRGIDPDELELSALVLHSDLRETGGFHCSNERLNRLQEAIRWGGRSNFVDIPTDCPQRDEREGWTGDYAVFAATASYNFDMGRFAGKWLRDVSAEQGRGGGIPMVVPKAGNPFPTMATSCWGDVCILAPWAEYLARGDLELLRRQYPTMKRFLKAAKWWSGLFSLGADKRHIWKLPFHFGDWAAPQGTRKDWLSKGAWVGTAYFANSCEIAARIAALLDQPADARRYRALRERIVKAYRAEFTDGAGRLKEEFQTGYVLPLHFGMTEGAESAQMAGNLVRLIDEAGGHLTTGFPGTPYILFALSDNGHPDAAYELLLQSSAPSWLYMIDAGGTTIWERWDALRPDGTVNVSDLDSGDGADAEGGGMVSFNHYAAGAVGDWLYRRVAGIEPTSGGYRTFRVAPVVGGGLDSAEGWVDTAYGRVGARWRVTGTRFDLEVDVPVSTSCVVELPDGTTLTRRSGSHAFSCELTTD